MAKYIALYNATVSARKLMADASPEQMKASMAEWIQWREEASKQIKVDFGMPLQAISRVTPEGLTESDNQASGYSIVEGDKAAVLDLLQKHPHLKRQDASIDVLEMLSMPGL